MIPNDTWLSYHTNKGIGYYKTLGFYVQKRKVGDFCYEQPVILIDKERWCIIQYNCNNPCLKAGDFFTRLKDQVDKLKRQIFEGDETVKRAQRIIEAVRDAGGFASDCFEGDC